MIHKMKNHLKKKPFKHLIQIIRIENMRQTKKELFEIIQQQIEVIEYWMEKALEQSDLKLIYKEGSIAENEQQHH